MLLAYDSRAATKDIDAVLIPREEGERLVRAVARELDLPEDWLNSDVVQFVSPVKEEKRRLRMIEEETGLIVHVPTARYLLAMKALACRRPIGAYQGDAEDLRFLIKKMDIRSVDQIQEAVDAFFPDDVVTESNRLYLKTLIGEAHEK
ncbi:MAG: hypothetical protein Q7Q73_16485 [Verrucomicrobiota bacterium JB024]|nr:hypothetical protein [Verrucomicrobiota bacterium JB024]